MVNARSMYQLILADFRERTRRYSYLMILLTALFFSYLVLTDSYSIRFGLFRCQYNSDWVGTILASASTVMFTIFGFYLVKNSISRDHRTGVGQIIAATTLSRGDYLFSKFISNILVLWSMVAVLSLAGVITLLFRGQPGSFDLMRYYAPIIMIPLPTMVMVAAMAVFFEAARWLRGTFGNIFYFFIAEIMLVAGMLEIPLLDLGGLNVFTQSIKKAIWQMYPEAKIGIEMGFIKMFGFESEQVTNIKQFQWDGIGWSSEEILPRLIWLLIPLVVVGLAIPIFDRFDSSRMKLKKTSGKEVGGKKEKEAIKQTEANIPVSSSPAEAVSYHQIALISPNYSLFSMITAELRLAFKRFHPIWRVIACFILVGQLVAPFDIVRMWITPVGMILPLVIWSSLGNRDKRYGTVLLLNSSPRPMTRRFNAFWMSGLLVALFALSGAIIRAGLAGDFLYLTALLVASLFIPVTALMLGTLSGSRKLFEVSYLIVWYIGSIDHLPALDLLGTTDQSITAEKLILLLILTLAGWATAWLARHRQLQS